MTEYVNPKLVVERGALTDDAVSWRSPSNIALVKYWGKHGEQLPRNPSISLTLQEAYTETTVHYRPKKGSDQGISLEFFFDKQPNPAFAEKVKQYFEKLVPVFPFLRQLDFTVYSTNSFPHSSGIASSASSMSALALSLCSLERRFFDTRDDDHAFREKASYLARLGSGSACRSIYPIASVWGKTVEIDGSSDLFGIPMQEEIHPVFHSFHDDILIVSKDEKSVSSRAGHKLMDDNIYANNRYQQARQNLHTLFRALKEGDLTTFGRITESEALTLHALMMTSHPPFILMAPNTLEIIQRVRQWRKAHKTPLYFTLDAGPNVHLLYPDEHTDAIQAFIDEELKPFCESQHIIQDRVGQGPTEL